MDAPATCDNCGAALVGPYCAACGHPRRSPLESVRGFLSHALDESASVDSRLLRSLRALFFRPGRLTREYLDGHRVRYTQPLQLYLLGAAAFFLVAAFRPFLWVDTVKRQVVGALPGMVVGNDLAAERLRRIGAEGMSLELYGERFVDVVNGWLPTFLIGSVVLFSLVLYALNRRREPRFPPHVVFALHWTAFYLPVMAAARLLPAAWKLQDLSLVVALVYLSVAQRRVHDHGIALAFGKALVLLLAFLVILVLWVQSAMALGLLLV